jgi:hypothetical protein
MLLDVRGSGQEGCGLYVRWERMPEAEQAIGTDGE